MLTRGESVDIPAGVDCGGGWWWWKAYRRFNRKNPKTRSARGMCFRIFNLSLSLLQDSLECLNRKQTEICRKEVRNKLRAGLALTWLSPCFLIMCNVCEGRRHGWRKLASLFSKQFHTNARVFNRRQKLKIYHTKSSLGQTSKPEFAWARKEVLRQLSLIPSAELYNVLGFAR
jgi:hypothetical protein